MASSARVVTSATSPARAYGTAVLQSGLAFTVAGVIVVVAFVEAGIQTLDALSSAHRATKPRHSDAPPEDAARSQAT